MSITVVTFNLPFQTIQAYFVMIPQTKAKYKNKMLLKTLPSLTN